MPIYLIIEERNDDDELVSWTKYDITEPPDIALVPTPEGAARIQWVDDLPNYFRRTVDDPEWLEPLADLNATSKPKPKWGSE